jgi:hypothetical protein
MTQMKPRKARTSFLLQSQIEQAMKVTRSNRSAAEYLRVSYPLYRRFAKQYTNSDGLTLFDAHKNQAGSGMNKISPSQRRSKLDDILLGKHPNYPREKLLTRLIINNYFPEQCSNCGFCQKRPTDLKTPLVLNTLNGSRTDYRLENLEILCYNCYFVNVGNLTTKDLKGEVVEAPERMEQVIDNEESLSALSTMNILSEEEKLDLIKQMKEL